MRTVWLVLPALVAAIAWGCASEPPRPGPAAAELEQHGGRDEVPGIELGGRDAIASARLGVAGEREALLWVDRDRALHLEEDGRDRVIAAEIGGRPVAGDEVVVWSEPLEPAGAAIRAMRPGEEPVTIARASGATSPIAVIGPRVVLVGSENGGVAGLWIADLAGERGLECVTNCALRAGQPWGDSYVPPPGDGGSIAIDGDAITYLDATGTARRASLGGAR